MTKLRKATKQDAPIVALVMMEAIGDDIMERYEAAGNRVPVADQERYGHILDVVLRPDTLYTWLHAIVATDDEGYAIGGMIAYAGDNYMQHRRLTFAMFDGMLDFDPDKMDEEVLPGEFYIDSLAVMPSFRGRGVARTLLQHGIEKAKGMSRPAVLACDPDNRVAHHLYASLGFADTYIYSLFGHPYMRMVHP